MTYHLFRIDFNCVTRIKKLNFEINKKANLFETRHFIFNELLRYLFYDAAF